jgi:hypothetical protein
LVERLHLWLTTCDAIVGCASCVARPLSGARTAWKDASHVKGKREEAGGVLSTGKIGPKSGRACLQAQMWGLS